MGRIVIFEINGECKGKGRPRFARQGNYVKTYTAEATRNYENWVKVCWVNTGEEIFPSDSTLKVEIIVVCEIPQSVSKKKREMMLANKIRPSKKPDCDNIAKSILDGLNGVAFQDDKQIVDLHIFKLYGEKPTVYVTINQLNEEV